MEEGLFAKHGIAVDLHFAGNDDQIFASVINGESKFGLGDPVFTAISKDKGGPGKSVAMMITKLGLSGFTNKASVPDIKTPADLKGLRIGSFPKPSTTYTLLEALIRDNGLKASGTTIVEAGMGAQIAALEAGATDIAVELEPAVSIAESQGYRVNFALDKFSEPSAITGLMVLESTIEKRPDLVQHMVSGLQEALVLLNDKPQIANEVAKKLFPSLGEQVIRNAVRRMLDVGMYPRSSVIRDEYWQRSLRARLASGEISAPQATSIAVDNQFALKAEQEILPSR
jgi:NitT/TauT family transport system substrate-binding protein